MSTPIPAEILLELASPEAMEAEQKWLEERAKELRRIQKNRKDEVVADLPITGELHDWSKKEIGSKGDFVIRGRIYNDVHGRFYDGQVIRTSLISKIEDGVAVTLNSNYRLVGEGARD